MYKVIQALLKCPQVTAYRLLGYVVFSTAFWFMLIGPLVVHNEGVTIHATYWQHFMYGSVGIVVICLSRWLMHRFARSHDIAFPLLVGWVVVEMLMVSFSVTVVSFSIAEKPLLQYLLNVMYLYVSMYFVPLLTVDMIMLVAGFVVKDKRSASAVAAATVPVPEPVEEVPVDEPQESPDTPIDEEDTPDVAEVEEDENPHEEPHGATAPLKGSLNGDMQIFIDRNDRFVCAMRSEDILYIDSADNYAVVHYLDNVTPQSCIIRNSIMGVESYCNPKVFFRCHRKYIINLNRISQMRRHESNLVIDLKGGDMTIPVSKNYENTLLAMVDGL